MRNLVTFKNKTNMQQEILVILRSSFDDNELNEINQGMARLSPEEKLNEACENGTIKELLPGVFKHAETYNFNLRKLQPGFSFLQLELGNAPLDIDTRFSINPHNFLISKCYS
jgi:hypothetical protein